MDKYDDRANDQADQHSQMMQEQRRKKPKTLRDILVEHGIIKDSNNEK